MGSAKVFGSAADPRPLIVRPDFSAAPRKTVKLLLRAAHLKPGEIIEIIIFYLSDPPPPTAHTRHLRRTRRLVPRRFRVVFHAAFRDSDRTSSHRPDAAAKHFSRRRHREITVKTPIRRRWRADSVWHTSLCLRDPVAVTRVRFGLRA